MIISASENTWSRAARRKRKEMVQVGPPAPDEARMICRITHEREAGRYGNTITNYLVLDWVKGRDRDLFESFASHVERKVMHGMKNGIH